MIEHTRQRPIRLVVDAVRELWALLLLSICGGRERPSARKRKLAPMASSRVAGPAAGTLLRDNVYSSQEYSSRKESDESSETPRRLLVMVKCIIDRAEWVVSCWGGYSGGRRVNVPQHQTMLVNLIIAVIPSQTPVATASGHCR
jgi:hypothetical protein